MSDEAIPCYTAACPECGSVRAVHVADVSDPAQMKHALAFVAEMRREKLTIGNTTVGEVRAGRVLKRCPPSCATGQPTKARRSKRDTKKEASLFT